MTMAHAGSRSIPTLATTDDTDVRWITGDQLDAGGELNLFPQNEHRNLPDHPDEASAGNGPSIPHSEVESSILNRNLPV